MPEESARIENQCHIHDRVHSFLIDDIIDDTRKNVCINEEPLTEFKGKHYCLFHLQTKEKDIYKFEGNFQARLKAVEEKLTEIEKLPEAKRQAAKRDVNYNFEYVWFPSNVNLIYYKFSVPVSFVSATFSDGANFNFATFSDEVSFKWAIFLDGVYFNSATFEEKSQVFFAQSEFSGALNFKYANFKGYAAFEGKQGNRLFIGEKALLNLQYAQIDDVEKISFHAVRLEPSWFINTDATGFDFTDCQWQYADGKLLSIKTELQNLRNQKDFLGISLFENPNALLTKACWQLADNHEESKSFAKASLFRQFANESKRLEDAWYLQPFTLHWWYYAVSFYGESWRRAFFVFLSVLLLFGLLYASPISTFDYGERKEQEIIAQTAIGKYICGQSETDKRFRSMNRCEGITHSLYVAALQRPEPKAHYTLTKFLIILETILAPLQAALLALAIRRKFMR